MKKNKRQIDPSGSRWFHVEVRTQYGIWAHDETQARSRAAEWLQVPASSIVLISPEVAQQRESLSNLELAEPHDSSAERQAQDLVKGNKTDV